LRRNRCDHADETQCKTGIAKTRAPKKPSSKTGGPALGDVEAHAAQNRSQADQGQSDQTRGILAVDRFAQGNAEAFALEAASAIEGLFEGDVACDGAVIQGAEYDAGGVDEFEGRLPSWRTTATAVMNDTVRAEQLRNCSMQRSRVPGLPRMDSPDAGSPRTAT